MEKTMKEKKHDTPPQRRTPLLTPKQAEEYIGLSVRTIYKYCRDDADPQIPHKRGPDGLIRIAPDGLERWFDNFKNRPRKPRVKKPTPTLSESR
jgi:predicted DNA-binding transcriptional regulator AlpA